MYVLLLETVPAVFVSSAKTSQWSSMSLMNCLPVSYLYLLGRQYLSHKSAFSFCSTHKLIRKSRAIPIQITEYTLPKLSSSHSFSSNMPKGGSRRNEHHCPQRSRGNCRWVDRPVRYCTTHSEMCLRHGVPHQTYQSCHPCKGEREASQRELRRQQVSNSTPGDGQHEKNQGKKKNK